MKDFCCGQVRLCHRRRRGREHGRGSLDRERPRVFSTLSHPDGHPQVGVGQRLLLQRLLLLLLLWWSPVSFVCGLGGDGVGVGDGDGGRHHCRRCHRRCHRCRRVNISYLVCLSNGLGNGSLG